MPNFSYTDSVYIQIDLCLIKHTLFILTYSGSFICESQFYYIHLAPVFGARYSWQERSFMVRSVVGSILQGGRIELCLVPATTGVTKAVVCVILSMGLCI